MTEELREARAERTTLQARVKELDNIIFKLEMVDLLKSRAENPDDIDKALFDGKVRFMWEDRP